VARVPSPNLDPALYSVGSILQNLMSEVSGVSDFQRGQGSSGTATEAAIINDGTMARMKEKQGKIEKQMRDIARRLIQLKMQYMKSEKMLRISLGANPQAGQKLRDAGVDLKGAEGDPDPTELFTSYTAEDIKGEYDIIVEAGSSTAFNETQRRRSIQEMLATVGPFLQMGKIDVDALLTYVLRFGFGIPNASEFMKADEEPQQQPGGIQEPAPPGGGGGVASVSGGILQPSGGVPQSAAQPPAY
jgi:hypothetical protein